MLVRLMIVGAVAILAVALLVVGLRHELRVIADRDTRPCPECQALAYLEGKALIDEQGHRLRFATPGLAAKYVADYARP